MEEFEIEEFMHKEYLAFKKLNYEPTEDGNVYRNEVDDCFTLVISVDEDTREPNKCWMLVTDYLIEDYRGISKIKDAYYQLTEDMVALHNSWHDGYEEEDEDE